MSNAKRIIIGSETIDSRHLDLDSLGTGKVTVPVSIYDSSGNQSTFSFDSDGNLKVTSTGASSGGNGAILDFTNSAIGATVSAAGALKVDGSAATQPVSGTLGASQSGTWNIGTVTTVTAVTAISNALPSGSNLIGKAGIDQSTPGTTNAVAVAQIGSTTVVTGGVAGTLGVGGNVATNVAIGTNPINNGAQAVSAENTAVTTTRMVQLVADLVGKLIVLPYANPENFVNGTTGAITDGTTTSIIASAGASTRNYVTSVLVTNSHATQGTFVKITDGASTILYEGYAAPLGGGFSASFPVPLRGSAATAVNAICVTSGANVIVSAAGYKGA